MNKKVHENMNMIGACYSRTPRFGMTFLIIPKFYSLIAGLSIFNFQNFINTQFFFLAHSTTNYFIILKNYFKIQF